MAHRITDRIRTNFLDNRGVAVDGYRIYFVMADGCIDYVEVKKALYSAENVDAAIKETIVAHQHVIETV